MLKIIIINLYFNRIVIKVNNAKFVLVFYSKNYINIER